MKQAYHPVNVPAWTGPWDTRDGCWCSSRIGIRFIGYAEPQFGERKVASALFRLPRSGRRAYHEAMPRHDNTIARNIVTALTAAAAEGPCQVFFSDVRLRASAGVYYYPDAMVVCGDVDGLDVIVSEPCVVIEVTSSSTGRIDRGEKLTAYRSISSVLAYLIVDHRRRRVERHWRADAASAWNRDEVAGHGTVNVPCLDVELSLDTIYRSVDLASIAEPDGAEYEADG